MWLSTLSPCRKAPFHSEPCFPPLAFFNCHEGREHGSGGGASLANASEAELAAVLYGGKTLMGLFQAPKHPQCLFQ